MTVTRRLRIGSIELLLRGSGAAGAVLNERSQGRAFEPADNEDPALELDLELDPSFEGRPASRPSPGFDSRATGENEIDVWRANAEGRLRIPAELHQPVRGTFRFASPMGAEAALRLGVALALPRRGGLLLHSSAVASESGVHLFLGRSGAGKSTIARLIPAGGNATRWADELVVVERRPAPQTRWRAVVPPFRGDQELPFGDSGQITEVNFLAQAPRHQRQRLSPKAALPRLLQCVLVYADVPAVAFAVLEVAMKLVQEVPCCALEFRDTPNVADVVLAPGVNESVAPWD